MNIDISFTNFSLIFDIVMLLVLLLVAFMNQRKGFVAGLLQLIGSLASVVLSARLAQKGAEFLFEKFLYQSYLGRMETAVGGSETVDLPAIMEQYGGFLPESFRQSVAEKAQMLIDAAAPQLAEQLVKEVLQPLTTPMIAMVLFFVCFALCKLVIGLVVALLTNINKVPLVGSVNQGLGFCLGLLIGLVDVYILLCVVYAVITLTSGALPYLNQTDLAGSMALRIFSFLNPFVGH